MSAWWLITAILWTPIPGWLLAAIIGALLGLFGGPAEAGWFSWGPDPKIEAANQALQRAAQIATEAATQQSRQHHQIVEAVTALSNERTTLAQQLSQLGQLAAKDAAWAAALQAAGPALVAVAVLALGGAAIWLVTRAGDNDSQLATALLEEIAGTGPGVLLADPGPQRLQDCSPRDDEHQLAMLEHTPTTTHTEGGMPF